MSETDRLDHEIVMDHFLDPSHGGDLATADGLGEARPQP